MANTYFQTFWQEKKKKKGNIPGSKKTRKKKLREVAEKNESLKKVERGVRLKQIILAALKDENGERTLERSKMNEICTKFYNDFYSLHVNVQHTPTQQVTEEVPNVMWEKIEYIIHNTTKRGKSPGADDVWPEYLKAGEDTLFKALVQRFTIYINSKRVPDAWKKSKTILLINKGNPEELSNYHLITLLSQVYKVFTRVTLNRIRKNLEMHKSREQTGFH
ncbi:uncharacterized protein LOC142072075 [Caretta caretta]|uniref:uncharacterized protein LOC142072075 n=1 Tax=Caretta caretta TaxID=8467 RepID=UPI003F4BD440